MIAPVAWLRLELLSFIPDFWPNIAIKYDHRCLAGKELDLRVSTAAHLEYRCEGAVLDGVPRGVRWMSRRPLVDSLLKDMHARR